MGFRFRKSINLGGGFRINLSKSGVGYSWGTKGIRFTKTAKGKNRTTLSIPGSGISYVTESGGKIRAAAPQKPKLPGNFSGSSPDNTGNNMAWVKLIICLLFGYLGVHKFMEKKKGMGFVYLFTVGLFGFGWMYDCIRYLLIALKGTGTENREIEEQDEWLEAPNTVYPPVEISEKRGFSGKQILLWGLTCFLCVTALAFFPHISGFLALAAAAVMIPVERWQNQINRFIRGKAKTAIVTVMTVAAFFATTTAELPEAERSNPNTAAVEHTQAADDMIILPTVVTAEAETQPPAAVERIVFDGNGCTVGVGRTVDIPFEVYPADAAISTLEASLDHAENASVSLENKEERVIRITGLIPGEVTVTLMSGETVVASKTVMIVEVMPDEMTIQSDPKAPEIGSCGMLTVKFDPQDVTNQKVTWHSDAPDVLKVNEDGSFEAISIGQATVTATHESGVTGTILIEVLPVQVDSVKISTGWDVNQPFCKGDSMTLTAEIFPENATDKSVTWTSGNESVATVSDKGVVKAVSQGTAVITATASNGKTGTYQITVDPSPQKFRVSVSIQMKSNDHVGNSWTKGAEFNGEAIASGTVVMILPGETFSIAGWAQENDSKSDYGSYYEQLTLTDEMCKSGFTVEGEAKVRENGGRYSGNYAIWYVKITFTPIA